MRTLLLALATTDTGPLRTALGTALGASSVDACQALEAAITWLENRPCDLLAIAGPGHSIGEAVARVRRVSRAIPVLAIVPDVTTAEAGAAWLAGADDVITAASLTAAQLPEGLDDVRHPERQVLRRIQRLWYAGPQDALRQHLVTRVGTRVRNVGLTGEGLAGLTTQDVEETHSAALVVNAGQEPGAIVLGIRRVKRTYPGLAITVVADGAHHDAFRRAGADECVAAPADVDHVLHAVGRAQAHCRTSFDLEATRSRETRLRTLVEQLPEAVVLLSPEHAVLAVNLAALRILGARDARQVLGSSLEPWLDRDDANAPDLMALVDGMSSGATREIVMRTRHLAEVRRLQLRAAPFQRESGGPPAALIVMREAYPVTEPAPAAPVPDVQALIERERHGWDIERENLTARIEALQGELEALRDESVELPRLLATTGRLRELGVDVDAIPALLEASHRLTVLEQEELPLLLARAEGVQGRQEKRDEELAALRAAAAQREALERATTEELEAARTRIAELEAALQAAHMREADAAVLRPASVADVGQPPRPVPDAQQWLLQEIARLGIVRTNRRGAVLEVDDRAAQLCGVADAAAMRQAGTLPAPLLAAAGDDTGDVVRFEVFLQPAGAATVRHIAGARIADEDESSLTWLLVECDGGAERAMRQGERQQAMSAVLEAAAVECRAVVDSAAARVVGPRPVDDAGESAHTAGARALARARAMLTQASTYGRKRTGAAAAHDVVEHLTALQPLLQRLATEDLSWQLQLPDAPLHACVTASAFERCVTSMVAVGRDALPMGGQLTLTLESAGSGDGAAVVRRPEASLTLEMQGYGLVAPEVTPALREAAAAMDATADVVHVDAFAARLTLRLARAFVLTQVA